MDNIRYLPEDIPQEVVNFFSYPYDSSKFPEGKQLLKHLLLYKEAVESKKDEIIVLERFMKPRNNFLNTFDEIYEDLSVDVFILSHYIHDWRPISYDEESESNKVLKCSNDYTSLNPWAYLISYDQMERALEKYYKPFCLLPEVSTKLLFPSDRTRFYQDTLFYRDDEDRFKTYYGV